MSRVLLSLALLGVAASAAGCAEGYGPPPPGYGPGHHVRWCLNHHPGYDPHTNLFPDRFGNLHPCEHP